MKTAVAFTLAATAVLLLTASAPAASITLNPTIDTFVSSAHPTSNYGGAGALGVSAAALSKGEFDSLLQFNLAGAKANFDTLYGANNWAIDGISLQLTATPPNNALFNGSGTTPVNFAGQVGVKWMQNDSWTEGNGTPGASSTTGGVTYSTLASFLSAADQALGNFAFGGGTSGNTNWSLGLASSLVADATAGNAVSLLMLPGDSGVGMLVNSRSVGTAASRPLLTISASVVPEPGTGGFAACLVFAAIGLRRRYPTQTV